MAIDLKHHCLLTRLGRSKVLKSWRRGEGGRGEMERMTFQAI